MRVRWIIAFAIPALACGGTVATPGPDEARSALDGATDATDLDEAPASGSADAGAPGEADAATDAQDDPSADVSDECAPFDAGCPALAPDPLTSCALGCGQTTLLCAYSCVTVAICSGNGSLWKVVQSYVACSAPDPDAASATFSDAGDAAASSNAPDPWDPSDHASATDDGGTADAGDAGCLSFGESCTLGRCCEPGICTGGNFICVIHPQ
jgi:hypothetical protein